MGKTSKVWGKFLELQQAVIEGNVQIGPEDIERFGVRPQGPHAHPRMPESIRAPKLPGKKTWLDSAYASADGTLCQAWGFSDDLRLCGFSLWRGKHGGNTLMKDAISLRGDIFGTDATGMPITQLHWRVGDTGGLQAALYVGGTLLPQTQHSADALAWTVGSDGHVYGLRWSKDAFWLHLIRCDLSREGAQERVSSDFYDCPPPVKQFVVIDETHYAFTTGNCHALRFVEQGKVVQGGDHPRGLHLARLGRGLCRIAPESTDISRVVPLGRHGADYPSAGSLSPLYHDHLSLIDDTCAYVSRLGENLYAWVVRGEVQPIFRYVTNLFRRDDVWCYWAYDEGHWFLMELPVPKK